MIKWAKWIIVMASAVWAGWWAAFAFYFAKAFHSPVIDWTPFGIVQSAVLMLGPFLVASGLARLKWPGERSQNSN
jgi:hypothetical protein